MNETSSAASKGIGRLKMKESVLHVRRCKERRQIARTICYGNKSTLDSMEENEEGSNDEKKGMILEIGDS